MAHVEIRMSTKIEKIEKLNDYHFKIQSSRGDFHCQSLVVATGGLSIPTMGASPFGYKVAEQFGIKVWPTRAGLVPFTLQPQERDRLEVLSGIAVPARVYNADKSFVENILFTHRGLSGPAVLQISSYWQQGESVTFDLLPDVKLADFLKAQQKPQAQKQIKTLLAELLPKRVVELFLKPEHAEIKIADLSYQLLEQIAEGINAWSVQPNGTEGYRTAEVTLGGVDCDAISSKTFAALEVPGLYFIGEVLDVTGWLGGFNFQWAWSSGWAAGQVV
jgi:predicted Rossmann fold flavoprotein